MRGFPSTIGGFLLLAACTGAPSDFPDTDTDTDTDTDAVDPDSGPCPDVGSGLSLEETAPFQAGDQGDGVVVLMGGGAEVDAASARLVDGAGGGDVLVLRATGSTSSYTAYFSDELAARITVPARAVATVRVDDPDAADDAGLACRLRRADAVWLAGGDQADYLRDWPATLHAGLAAAVARGAAIGGTSAGAMSWSALAYDASDGGIDSRDALRSPGTLPVGPSPFAAVPGTLVDTHFSARDREGRLIAFVARAASLGAEVIGVGIDEDTALILDGGTATVRSDDGGSAWSYRVDSADVSGPLDAEARRVRIVSGNSAPWPPSFADGEIVVVEDGTVR